MLKKLLGTVIVFAAGYAVGAIFGFRAAVIDYVEDDAAKLERKAEKLYPSAEEGAATAQAIVEDALEDADENTAFR
jgi:hypothetical protein